MARTDNFTKFVKQPKSGAVKEKFRQEKKKAKKERAEAIEKHYAKKREERMLQQQQPGVPAKKSSTANKYAKGKPAEQTTSPKEAKAFKAGKPASKAPVTAKEEKPEKKRGSKREQKKSYIKPHSKADIQTSAAVQTKDHHKKPGGDHAKTVASTELMPLNKYVAHSGVCARRDAAILVKEGKVLVNGEVVTDPGTKVSEADVVKVNGKKITPSRNFVYILLNKPKDYITTAEDPQGRRTVLDLVRHATTERIYPVGRLDRNTSGVLLLTNDGELAQKLSHPSHEVKKIYEVKLDRVLTKGDMEKIAAGLTLEDGFVAPDAIAYADAKDKSVIGIEIHSGRNRIVRRIFEHLKYDVKGLDRVMFAGLTKKDVQRGKWRFLKEKELRILKFMNKSYVKPKAPNA